MNDYTDPNLELELLEATAEFKRAAWAKVAATERVQRAARALADAGYTLEEGQAIALAGYDDAVLPS